MNAVRPPFCPLPHAAIFGFDNILTHAHDRATILELDLRLCVRQLPLPFRKRESGFGHRRFSSICPLTVVAGAFLKPVGRLRVFVTLSSRHPGHRSK